MALDYLLFVGLSCYVQIVCCTQFSVYKDINIGLDKKTMVIGSDVTGTHKSLVELMSRGDRVGVRLAFATGECGQEIWNLDPTHPVQLGKENRH